jgi:hypothetical protein
MNRSARDDDEYLFGIHKHIGGGNVLILILIRRDVFTLLNILIKCVQILK